MNPRSTVGTGTSPLESRGSIGDSRKCLCGRSAFDLEGGRLAKTLGPNPNPSWDNVFHGELSSSNARLELEFERRARSDHIYFDLLHLRTNPPHT